MGEQEVVKFDFEHPRHTPQGAVAALKSAGAKPNRERQVT